MESHFRYPRACDEFWFAATGRGTKEATLEEMKKANAAFRPLCEKAGVKFSFQQGVTLGHGQMLHAKELKLIHPRTGEAMRFTCGLPEDFEAVGERLRRES